jgi:CRISPR-associated endonuclease/helicase Cas3
MVFDLILAQMDLDSQFDDFRSHPQKKLRVHTRGVCDGVARRTSLPVPQIAAIFHDLGKINPNFQPKLDNKIVQGYSNHAYLSTWSFLRFCRQNGDVLRQLGLKSDADFFSVIAIIAHHHGNLPNFQQALSNDERHRLSVFLESEPILPISEYLEVWLPHKPFTLWDDKSQKLLDKSSSFPDKQIDAISSKLDFFLDTQFGFGSLLEADKRDAGDNKWFRREEQLDWAREQFTPLLAAALPKTSTTSALNQVRTAIREEAVRNLQTALAQGKRTFSLTAPTGAGKTLTLLAIKDAIRQIHPDHSVCYTLPFLTITEQVEQICRGIFGADIITRIDSRSQNETMEKLLAELEQHPEKAADILKLGFSNETFDAAFIITTFVQVFETLLTNRGAPIMRLPNFAKTIFLIDEVQALPPRLYTFFAAFLQAFCEKFDSYAVFSTATMPALALPEKNLDAKLFFPNYETPPKLLDFEKHYQHSVFDRYVIENIAEGTSLTREELTRVLDTETESCLVILNTIDDTRHLYDQFCSNGSRPEIVLLNTRFTLEDRQEKLRYCQSRLNASQRVLLISTQLIEAGVDIDFPVVYRDLCPLPNLIQSAGRCNRNGKRRDANGNSIPGEVRFFELREADAKKARAELVYSDQADTWSLDFSRQKIIGRIAEKDLLAVQAEFFLAVNQNLKIGDHRLRHEKTYERDNLIKRINELAFQTVGSFRLIDEKEFGTERRYYVARNDNDLAWEQLGEMAKQVAQAIGFADVKVQQQKMLTHLRTMSGRIVTLRFHNESETPPVKRNDHSREVIEYCGLCKLENPSIDYSHDTGIQLHGQGIAIL